MEYRHLGKSGVLVSALCLGTLTFGNEADESAAAGIVSRFLEVGGNFIDTADVYQEGVAEEITGRAIAGNRDRVVLATKGRLPMSEDLNDRGAGRRHLTRAVDASLRRLGTDWIDLYQIHWPDPNVPIDETLSTLDELVRGGKIRFGGLSNYLGWELQRAIDVCERYGWAGVTSHQPQYSLICREIERETLPLCHRNTIAVLPWSPLGGGLLSGKYTGASEVSADSRIGRSKAHANRILSERNLQIAEAVAKVAADTEKSSSQVAINWVLHRPGVVAPIIGARSLRQLEDNLGAEGWELDGEHIRALDDISQPPLLYPHDMYRMFAL